MEALELPIGQLFTIRRLMHTKIMISSKTFKHVKLLNVLIKPCGWGWLTKERGNSRDARENERLNATTLWNILITYDEHGFFDTQSRAMLRHSAYAGSSALSISDLSVISECKKDSKD